MTVTSNIAPVRCWETKVTNATYNTAARQGKADEFTEIDIPAGDTFRIGQILSGGNYTVYNVLLQYDISAYAGHQIGYAEFTLDTFSDLTTTQTWTCNLRHGLWADEGAVEGSHTGSGGYADDQRLAYFSMSTADDVPASAVAWTNDGLRSLLQTKADAGAQYFKMYLHSNRIQSELAPINSERWQCFPSYAELQIEHQTPVSDVAFSVPALAMTATDVPQETAAFSVPPAAVAVPATTGPIELAAFSVPVPVLTATTVRRWGNDELYGVVADNGRRIGEVV